MNQLSLSQYLNRRYLAITGFLVLSFTALVGYMNLAGLDDATAYYMFYEAELIEENYQPGDLIEEFDQGLKEYYWGADALPTEYQKLLEAEPAGEFEVKLYSTDSDFIYILPYPFNEQDTTLYVLHLFSKQEHAENDRLPKSDLGMLAIIVLLTLIGVVFYFSRQISGQLKAFEGWMLNASQHSATPTLIADIPDKVQFRELHQAASKLKESIEQEAALKANEQQLMAREKNFLLSLSHELRTPIAVISAAISVLKKRAQLSEKDLNVLDKLTKANQNMQLMTTTLLQVWRKQKSISPAVPVNLTNLLQTCIEELQMPPSIKLNIQGQATESLITDPVLIEITLSNLLRNASQYSATGEINIQLDKLRITISNPFEKHNLQQGESYGFGFGLYLVEKICQQQGWLFSATNQEEIFNVTIDLH